MQNIIHSLGYYHFSCEKTVTRNNWSQNIGEIICFENYPVLDPVINVQGRIRIPFRTYFFPLNPVLKENSDPSDKFALQG